MANQQGKLVLRRSEDRGKSDEGWLKSYHSFSFADYFDPNFNAFGPLRVINEDRVSGGKGFPMHSHANFEIFSYPLSGALMHKDSMNHKEVIRRGAVQHTSAGTGLAHSEYNASETEPVHFLQVWIKPHTRNLEPAYQTVEWSDADKTNKLCLILSDDKESGAIKLNAHAQVYASILEKDKEVTHQIPEGRNGYIHLAQTGGSLEVNGQVLEGGDAVFVYGPLNLKVKSTSDKPAEFLLFNLPPQ